MVTATCEINWWKWCLCKWTGNPDTQTVPGSNFTDDTWLFLVILYNSSQLFRAVIELELWLILFCTAIFHICLQYMQTTLVQCYKIHTWIGISSSMDMLKVLLSYCIPKTGDHEVCILHNPACQENVSTLFLKQCHALIFHEKTSNWHFLNPCISLTFWWTDLTLYWVMTPELQVP